jgi:hypothetical protein
MRCYVLLLVLASGLYGQADTPERQAVIDKLTSGLLEMVKNSAQEAKASEALGSWLKAAEQYEGIVALVPPTAPALKSHVLIGDAHLDAARCWTKYRESRKGYDVTSVDERIVGHLDAADQAFRDALGSFPRLRGDMVIQFASSSHKAEGVLADIKINQAYVHVLQNNLAAAADDYRELLKLFPGSAAELNPALHRVEDAKRKQEGGIWTDDNKVDLAAWIVGKTPVAGFVLEPLLKFGYRYYEAHSDPLPYRTQ